MLNLISAAILASALTWPEITPTARPWAYNWWMGSAVDEAGLEYQCAEMADKGFGGFHVIPIYGADGKENRAKWRPLLSPEWVEAWNMAAKKARAHGLDIDLTMGSGWCFGGPWIDEAHASYCPNPKFKPMKVKRAGKGGEGYMINPFDPEAMKIHVAQFDKVFGKNGTAEKPRAFYHDSYEYYGAMPKPEEGDGNLAQLATFKVWADWCKENGYLTRNEAHGAPSNWLDLYAVADIPETEINFSDKDDPGILIAKFASSAAHLKGTTLVSSETCTWLDEHFCETPDAIKRRIDNFFLGGVNHIFYHGLCYSPVDAVWPGWIFYASLEMNPRNPIWREMRAVNDYVARCQAVFQNAKVDNDLILAWDYKEALDARTKENKEKNTMSVHDAKDWLYALPVGKTAKEYWNKGYQFDFVNPGTPGNYSSAAAVRSPFNKESNGFESLRLKYQGETIYFVVNHSGKDRIIVAAGMTTMDPLTGKIEDRDRAIIPDGGSLFVRGSDFKCCLYKGDLSAPKPITLTADWSVTRIAGGPDIDDLGRAGSPLPAVKPQAQNNHSIPGWQTWDEYFSGTMLYTATIEVPAGYTTLDLGEVHEIARVRANGIDLGVKFMPPYTFTLAGPQKINLEIEITNLGANRLRYNDIAGINWKYFCNKPAVSDKGYSREGLITKNWQPKVSGLIGPIKLR